MGRQYLDKSGLEVYHNNAVKKFADKSEVADILEKIDVLENDICEDISETDVVINDIKKTIGYDNDSKISFEGMKNISDCTSVMDALRVLDEIVYRLRFKYNSINNNLFYIKSLEENNIVYNSTDICRLSIHSKDVEYSYDGESWYILSNVENITLDKDEHVYFRYVYNYIEDGYLSWIDNEYTKDIGVLTKPTKTFDVGGDIRYIIYGVDTKKSVSKKELYALFSETKIVNANNLLMPFESIGESGCEEMFYKCTLLVTAPELPATALAAYCYQNMFYGTSLTVAPELPATKLYDYCYSGMFAKTLLATAPELPATALAAYCYSNMFAYTSLTVAPELPATKLYKSCYSGMFDGCGLLVTAPELPATELASAQQYCYAHMFRGCVSLITAPDLLSVCEYGFKTYYWEMFDGCTNLKYIKCLLGQYAEDINMENWVRGVSDSGTFVKKSGSNWTYGKNGIPTNWVVEEV